MRMVCTEVQDDMYLAKLLDIDEQNRLIAMEEEMKTTITFENTGDPSNAIEENKEMLLYMAAPRLVRVIEDFFSEVARPLWKHGSTDREVETGEWARDKMVELCDDHGVAHLIK